MHLRIRSRSRSSLQSPWAAAGTGSTGPTHGPGVEGAEGAAAPADGDKPAADGAKGDKKEGDDNKPAEKKPAEKK